MASEKLETFELLGAVYELALFINCAAHFIN